MSRTIKPKIEHSKTVNAPSLKSRVVEVLHLEPEKLKANPNNPRKHGPAQRAALRAVLAEIGFAGALLARRNGEELELIDGHLRKEELPKGEKVPVVVVDLTEEEARKLAAVYDPIGAMAETDAAALDELLQGLDYTEDELRRLVDAVLAEDPLRGAGLGGPPELPSGERDPIQQVTFTLHDAQAETVRQALEAAKAAGEFLETGNENSNGNALARIAEAYLNE